MAFPPSKRLKAQAVSPAPDPFGDEVDFTQDDLAQMDIMASQAALGDGRGSGSKRAFERLAADSGEQSDVHVRCGRRTFALGDGSEPENSAWPSADDDLHYKHLEEQHADLKRKLGEVEQEILMKNGEIRVLRDSLSLLQQEKERQRQLQMLQEKEKTDAQSQREKELSRKVQSLQSELHFKEAEINEMRGRLQKTPATPTPQPVPSPASRGFLTKESFSANVRTSPRKQEDARPEESRPFLVSEQQIRDVSHEGCVLLRLLLQHPLDPSSVGLCELLSVNPHSLTHTPASTQSRGSSSSSSTSSRSLHPPRARFHPLQSLATSALSALSLRHPGHAPRSCPAAPHFLPLLAFHISTFCQALESAESPSSLSASSDSSLEACLSAQEGVALAALRALHHVLNHSGRALDLLLRTPPSPLLRSLVQLTDPACITAAGQKGAIVSGSLECLCVMAERAQEKQLPRLQVVLSGGVLMKSLETSARALRLCVRFLSLVIFSEEEAEKLCSHDYPCHFLRIFQSVSSRPDQSITDEEENARLELEIVRLLTKLFMQKMRTWTLLCQSSCQCSKEVVRMVVVCLHRQWRRSRRGAAGSAGAALLVLREGVMLLHWLLLRDSSFSHHGLEVLVPAIRDAFRLLPDLSESEELALDEICRSETECVEDMDTETSS